MKTPMELVQDACLEVSAKGYHEPYEEMKLAALSLAERLLALGDPTPSNDADGYATVKQVCLVCGQPSGHWRHWPNVPGEHYVVPVHAEQSDFHSFQATEKR